ncbi:hypothetical protein NST74_29550 [Paenibacillus sp. FSL F4-0125]|uniref:hypothetical protein n=1 Tax=Paenibacillus sp. FSL F4-0125 TaxID=2954730 RepID=UPI0030F68AF4
MYKIDIGEFDGNSWEAIIQRCLKDKYENELYQRMPANVSGDSGIEGLTVNSGKVFQCYCPESQYETKVLTTKQISKITTDLKKLVTYEKQLKKVLGAQKIMEWHLITPEFKDKSLVAHCRTKEKEYQVLDLDHLDSNFKVLIKEHTDFSIELRRHMLLMEYKIDISVEEPKRINWDECDSDHIKNLRRKIRSLVDIQPMSDEEKNRRTDKIVENFVFYFQRGMKVIEKLEGRFPEQYSRFNRIKLGLGERIEDECLLSQLPKDKLYQKIQQELLDSLIEGLGENFENAGIEQLSKRIIAEWLMLCPLDFGG